MNPVALAPLFVIITQQYTRQQQNHVAFVAALATGIILSTSILTGNALLKVFGVDIAAVQVAGGIIIFMLGLGMANGKTAKIEPDTQKKSSLTSMAIVPIAIPITAGPGAISVSIVWASENPGWQDLAAGIGVCLLLTVVFYFTFRYAALIASKLGETTLDVITRISGLILTAIAVNVIAVGLGQLLPGLS